MRKEPVKFINNDSAKGIDYDYALINREFKKLKVPREYYTPTELPFNTCKWLLVLSDRSRGKTTNLLLYGLTMHKLYGTTIQYVRQSVDMIAPKNAKSLFDVIISNGYVPLLTDGKFDTIVYDRRAFYYASASDGKITRDTAPICNLLSIDGANVYKSSYNAPFGDFILFDEFISRTYRPNEFVTFLDLLKTICRDRLSPVIVMSANTIDKTTPYFREMSIVDVVKNMKQGDKRYITTPLGTSIYVELLAATPDKKRKIVNLAYYGFDNPELAAVTGSASWSMREYPHIPDVEGYKVLDNKHYIKVGTDLIQLKMCEMLESGTLFIACEYGKGLHSDSVVYTMDPNTKYDKYTRYRLGYTKLDKIIFNMYEKNLFMYRYNDIGTLVDRYIATAKKGLC